MSLRLFVGLHRRTCVRADDTRLKALHATLGRQHRPPEGLTLEICQTPVSYSRQPIQVERLVRRLPEPVHLLEAAGFRLCKCSLSGRRSWR